MAILPVADFILPREAGADKQVHSRDASAPELCGPQRVGWAKAPTRPARSGRTDAAGSLSPTPYIASSVTAWASLRSAPPYEVQKKRKRNAGKPIAVFIIILMLVLGEANSSCNQIRLLQHRKGNCIISTVIKGAKRRRALAPNKFHVPARMNGWSVTTPVILIFLASHGRVRYVNPPHIAPHSSLAST